MVFVPDKNLKHIVSPACRPRVFQIALFKGFPNLPHIPPPPPQRDTRWAQMRQHRHRPSNTLRVWHETRRPREIYEPCIRRFMVQHKTRAGLNQPRHERCYFGSVQMSLLTQRREQRALLTVMVWLPIQIPIPLSPSLALSPSLCACACVRVRVCQSVFSRRDKSVVEYLVPN